jgi:hypothetical protein
MTFKTYSLGDAPRKSQNLKLLGGQEEKLGSLQELGLRVLDETAQLGDRDSLLTFGLASTSPEALAYPIPTYHGCHPALETQAKGSAETEASHAWATGALRLFCYPGVTCHLLCSWRGRARSVFNMTLPELGLPEPTVKNTCIC